MTKIKCSTCSYRFNIWLFNRGQRIQGLTHYLVVILKNTFVFQAGFQPPRFAAVEGGARVFTALQRPYSPLTSRSAQLGSTIGLFCINKQKCWEELNIFIKQNIMIPETLRNSTNAFKWRFYLSQSCKKESLMRCHLNSNTCLMAVFLYPQRVTVYECLQFSKCIYKNCFFINNVMPFFLLCYSHATTYEENCWLWHFCFRYVSKIVLFHTLKLKIL